MDDILASWKEIDEYAETGVAILGFYQHAYVTSCPYAVVAYRKGGWYDPDDSSISYQEPTHYMTLPKAPK